MGVLEVKKRQRIRRIKRVRKKIFGTKEKPRVTLTQTNKNLYAQAIDDVKGMTLAFVSTNSSKLGLKTVSRKNIKTAEFLAEKMQEKLQSANIKTIIFDRRSKKYHGVIKSFAEKLRASGVKF